MSRGIGTLQRKILATLEEAKRDTWHYPGSYREENWSNSPTWRWDRPGWVTYRGARFRLADEVYDLRASLVYLAEREGGYSHARFVAPTFQAAFSRAVKGLCERGFLRVLTLVPVAEYERGRLESLADGEYMLLACRQRRFVSREKPA